MMTYNDIILRNSQYKQGQLERTDIDTIGTAVSGPSVLLLFIMYIAQVLRQCQSPLVTSNLINFLN